MNPWLFFPELIASVSFLLKRLFRDEKLADNLTDEVTRRIGGSSIDVDAISGFRRQLLDVLEIDGIKKDIQSASLATFASTLMLASSAQNRHTAFLASALWVICFLLNSRFSGLSEGVRTSARIRRLHITSFVLFLCLSVGLKAASELWIVTPVNSTPQMTPHK